jgi:polyhydroxybutyrate depolymerase
LLVFHGAGGSATGMREGTGFDREAERLGYIVAYLEGSGVYRSWNDSDGADLQFVADVVEELRREVSVDTSRMVAAGFSSGGRFVQRLACDPDIRIAAFASVSSTIDRPTASTCDPRHSVSALFVLGSADPSLERPASLTVAETFDFWGGLNGCSVAPPTSASRETIGGGIAVERREYSGCVQGSAVVLYLLHGHGHGWPRVVGTPCGTDTLSTARLIADFLSDNG